jgi:hypothetical protein
MGDGVVETQNWRLVMFFPGLSTELTWGLWRALVLSPLSGGALPRPRRPDPAPEPAKTTEPERFVLRLVHDAEPQK